MNKKIKIKKARHKQEFLTFSNNKKKKITIEIDLSKNSNKAITLVRNELAKVLINLVKESQPKTDTHYILPLHLDNYLENEDGALALLCTPEWERFQKLISDNGYYIQWFDNNVNYRDDPLSSFCFNSHNDDDLPFSSVLEKRPKEKVEYYTLD